MANPCTAITSTAPVEVSFARCSLRLEPRSGDGQQLVSHSVEIRPNKPDCLGDTAPVGDPQERRGIEAPLGRPRMPDELDARPRVHQDTIQVEEHGPALYAGDGRRLLQRSEGMSG